ncbi:MAG: hypothetical protein AAF439_15880 [Pseudomonadota bacterium]
MALITGGTWLSYVGLLIFVGAATVAAGVSINWRRRRQSEKAKASNQIQHTDKSNKTIIGMWFWGGVMVWVLVSVVYTIAWGAMHLEHLVGLKDEHGNLKAGVSGIDGVCRMYLAMEQHGSLLGVALGFVSLAWVNFFMSKKDGNAAEGSAKPSSIGIQIVGFENSLSRLEASVKQLDTLSLAEERLTAQIAETKSAVQKLQDAKNEVQE